jgi:hypothetical protein
MRDFMEDYSQCRRDSHRQTNQVRRSDNHSIYQIVDAIGEQIHVTDRMDGIVVFQDVLMPPEEKLFKDKKYEYSCQDTERGMQLVLEFLKRFRQEMDKGIPEQTTDSEADHDKNYLFEPLLAHRDKGNANERKKAHK